MLKVMKKRQFRLLLACISLLLLINTIQNTYAKYVSSADANSNFSIARWAFVVNNQDVLANGDFSNTIVPVFDTNQYIATGVIAPTSTGYFDIEINSSDVGVAFDQTLTLDQGDDNTVTDIVFTGYQLNSGTLVSLNDVTTATLTSTHPLNEQIKVNTYRIYIKWNDNSQTENMDNSDDAEASAIGTASVAVNLDFVQKAS